jgi:hypothetical protein
MLRIELVKSAHSRFAFARTGARRRLVRELLVDS